MQNLENNNKIIQEDLLTLEALYVRETEPELNTSAEYRSREFTIMF